MTLATRIVHGAISDGFCRWCHVLVGCEGHRSDSECPAGMAEEELREPLTRERARAVLAEYLTRADTPDALRLAICRVNDGPDECADALADLLVDAAAGRVR